MKYMYDMQNGKAEIRTVVEQEQEIHQYYWWCHIDRFEFVGEEQWTENDELYLYSAYLDTRKNSLYPWNDAIQVLTVSFGSMRRKVFCNIFNEEHYAVVEGYVREIWQRGWDPRDQFYNANLITCPIPKRLKLSSKLFISISTMPCRTQRTALRVHINLPKQNKEAVAVCVKGMDFQEDVSQRLVEWLEAQYLFGVSAVTIYKYTVSKQVQNVLTHYERLGKLVQVRIDSLPRINSTCFVLNQNEHKTSHLLQFIEKFFIYYTTNFHIPLTLPGHSPNLPLVRSRYIARNRQQKRRHELIPYNDCFYRHITTHRYTLILDIDELVVPLEHDTYSDLLSAIEANTTVDRISSLSFSNVFKFPAKTENTSWAKHMYMLRNSLRSRRTSDRRNYGKSMTNTATVATVFNHFALHRLTPNVTGTIYVPERLAIKLHYKLTCPVESRKECAELQDDTVVDRSIDRFADELERRVDRTLCELHLL
ncbi:unnamed protein product [Angiostrongylus costaricensis]|uniref:Glycosyltransferase family 92 protein n=1 Tax=Angiostrongylus costaricensis TaxID=334426 RepID=A0A0R3Q2E2_ANGCS|nr:unnamed protein product [Angiostrongylus costaricensis]